MDSLSLRSHIISSGFLTGCSLHIVDFVCQVCSKISKALTMYLVDFGCIFSASIGSILISFLCRNHGS